MGFKSDGFANDSYPRLKIEVGIKICRHIHMGSVVWLSDVFAVA